MKKLFIFVITIMIFLPIIAFAQEPTNKIDLYLFYGDTCPHCKEEKEDLKELQEEYSQLEVHLYEVYNNKENQKLLNTVAKELGVNVTGVPFTIIGNRNFVGYSKPRKKYLEETIEYYSNNPSTNVVEEILNNNYKGKPYEDSEADFIDLPLFGELNIKRLSLPIITILIGIVDGFNPCALWILLFLISMLIGMENKKRMWALGLTFILTSGIVYFIFMAAWLNIIMLIGTIILIRTIIGVLGVGGGLFNIRNYLKERKQDGCQVVDKTKRKTIFNKIKRFTHEKKFYLAILGIIVLAISVNLIEMLCSLGLPAIYVQILELSNVSTVAKYFYLFLYVLFFMLDDIIIFAIAMVTLKATGISTKYTKYSHLIGGIIMIIVGLLLIFKPEILMFG